MARHRVIISVLLAHTRPSMVSIIILYRLHGVASGPSTILEMLPLYRVPFSLTRHGQRTEAPRQWDIGLEAKLTTGVAPLKEIPARSSSRQP